MILCNITRWPSLLIFLIAGAAAAGFAFVTVNLFGQAMANRDFVREFGWLAIEHGALLQMAQLSVQGGLALLCWLTFKLCEQELGSRYFAWARARGARRNDGPDRSKA